MSEYRVSYSLKRKVESTIILLFCAMVLVGVAFVLMFVYKPDRNALGALASVCMDVISIIVLIILIIGITFERNTIDRTTKLFLALMAGTMLALFLDFLTWSFDGALSFEDTTFLIVLMSLCMGSILACVFGLYLSSYLYDVYNMKRAFTTAKVCGLCNLFAFVLTFTLGITHNAFDIIDGHYQTGALYDFVTVIPVLTLLHMTGYSIRYIKMIGWHDVIAVVGYISIMIVGALVEAEYSIGTTYVSLTIAAIFIFVMLQNRLIDRVNAQREILAKKLASQNEKLETMEDIINAEKKNVEKWMEKSNTDGLTHFYNRHAYQEEVKAMRKGEISNDFVYVSMDVNGLKTVNDTLGHEAGDELLIGACDCMMKAFGAYGKLFRTGGDEFVALIVASDDTLAEIKKNMEKAMKSWHGKLVRELAISCGYVTKKEAKDMTVNKMAVLADKRMYESKTKYYQEKGIDRRGQRDAYAALHYLYSNIYKINLSNDTFQIVTINEKGNENSAVSGNSFSQYISSLKTSGQIHPDDLSEFLEKINQEYLDSYFKDNKKPLRIMYRKKNGAEFIDEMIEVILANDYRDDNKNLFLYVKDIV